MTVSAPSIVVPTLSASDNDVAEGDSDAQLDAGALRDGGVAGGHTALDLDRASDGIDDARELDERAVPHELENSAAMFGNQRVEKLDPQCLEGGEGAHLVLTHEAAVANNVSNQNGGEATLHGFLPENGE